MKIFLIRHGQSLGDVDHKVRSTMPDNRIPLTERGIAQAGDLHKNIISILSDISPKPYDKYKDRLNIEFSPFERTRQTKDVLISNLQNKEGVLISKTKENFLLSEQQFGLYNGLTGDEIKGLYPVEHDWHQKYLDHNSRFFSPIPMGESRFQVTLRAKLFLNELKENYIHSDNVIVVSHATFIRAFIMVLLDKTPEWFDEEKKPNNCSIRLLKLPYREDCGYVFEGFKS